MVMTVVVVLVLLLLLLRSLLMLLLLLAVHSATSSSGVILTKLNGSFCAERANAATLTAPFFCEVEFLCDVNNTCPSGVDVRMPCPAGTHLPYRSAGTTDASCIDDSASVSLLLAQSDGPCFTRVDVRGVTRVPPMCLMYLAWHCADAAAHGVPRRSERVLCRQVCSGGCEFVLACDRHGRPKAHV